MTQILLLTIFRVRGEKWSALRMEALRKLPFPESPEYRWIGEGVVWSAMGRRYLIRYVNEMLRIYWVPGMDDADDHLTRSFDPRDRERMKSLALARALTINDGLRWWYHNRKYLYLITAMYVRFALHTRCGLWRQLETPAANGMAALGAGIACRSRHLYQRPNMVPASSLT